jgi:hypothetical protein
MLPGMNLGRAQIVRHSIGNVQLLKVLLPPAAGSEEIAGVFRCLARECLESGVRGALLVDNDRPAIGEAELKSAVAVIDLSQCPPNFRLAVVAFRKPAYRAYLTALATLPGSAAHARLFWDELDAMQWLREQFPESGARVGQAL